MFGEVGVKLRADESDFVVGVNDGFFGRGGRAENASGQQTGERRSSSGSGELASIHQKYDSAFTAEDKELDAETLEAWRAGRLFLRSDAQCLHFAIKVAAFQPQEFGSASDVAAGLFEFLEDVLALRRFADFL